MAMIRELRQWWQEVRSYWTAPLSLRDPALVAYFGGGTTSSGETVSEATALNCSAVWSAVNIIAGDVASLPLFHYKVLENGGKEKFTTSKLYRVLHDEFNPEMSAMVGRETMMAHVLLWGNGYAEIQRNALGQVVALWPIEPNRVQPYRETPGSELLYRVQQSSGTTVTVTKDRMLHVPGLGFDGICGYSVVSKARDSIGMQLASERLGAETFANGVPYSGYFQHPKALGDKALQHLRESIQTDTSRGKRGGFRILEEGMTWAPGSMPLKDAQFLETRKFQVTEIARWFTIPPHKLGDLERATFSNIEQENIAYVSNCLRRWLVRVEMEYNRKLIPALEYGNQKCEHQLNALLRGDVASRYAAYAIGRNGGWLSANKILEYENENPIPGGDVYLVQGAMVPLDRLDDIVDKQVAPDPAPVASKPQPTPNEETNAARVQAIVDDLKADVARGNEALAVELAALRQAEGTDPTQAAVARIDALAADLETQIRATARATEETILEGLGTDHVLRDWQQATIAMVAARLVRRELARLKQATGDVESAPAKLDRFYTRFSADGLDELRPWLHRLRSDPPLDGAVKVALDGWATAAREQCTAALLNGGLEHLAHGWAVGREDALTRLLLEAIHAE